MLRKYLSRYDAVARTLNVSFSKYSVPLAVLGDMPTSCAVTGCPPAVR